MKWLLLGYGDLPQKRLASALQTAHDSELVQVWGRQEWKVRNFASSHNIPSYSSGEEGLEKALRKSEIDAVYVCTPPHSHYRYTKLALEAGKHVLTEKPFTTSVETAQELTDSASTLGLTLGVAYYRRFLPTSQFVTDVLNQGTLGKITAVRISTQRFFNPDPNDPKGWRVDPSRSGGGVLMDVGCHRVDLLAYWFGGLRPTSLIKQFNNLPYMGEDTALLVGHSPDQVLAEVFVSWASKRWEDSLEIIGSKGSLVSNNLDRGPVELVYPSKRESFELPFPVNTHQPLAADFSQAVADGKEPLCPAKEAVEVLKILNYTP